jgi:hypothetical protein
MTMDNRPNNPVNPNDGYPPENLDWNTCVLAAIHLGLPVLGVALIVYSVIRYDNQLETSFWNPYTMDGIGLIVLPTIALIVRKLIRPKT